MAFPFINLIVGRKSEAPEGIATGYITQAEALRLAAVAAKESEFKTHVKEALERIEHTLEERRKESAKQHDCLDRRINKIDKKVDENQRENQAAFAELRNQINGALGNIVDCATKPTRRP